MKKYFLCLQPSLLTCYSADKGTFTRLSQWNLPDDELPDSLRAFLTDNREAEYVLLFDLPEEECYLQDIKSHGFLDRRQIIEKLSAKRFPDSLLSFASIAGTRQRRSVQLSGVDSNPVLANLLALLSVCQISLGAVHSVTTLVKLLVKKISAEQSAQLFVVKFRDCYRLIGCLDAVVLFSRRVDIAASKHSTDCHFNLLQTSVEETLVYLQRLHEGWVPDVVLIGPSESADRLRAGLQASNSIKLVNNIQSHLPLNAVAGSCDSEVLLMSVATRAGCGYARSSHRQAFITRRIRNMGAALLLCAIGSAASSIAVAEKVRGARLDIADRYDQLAESLDSNSIDLLAHYDYPVEAVRQSLVTARLLDVMSENRPLDVLQEVSAGVLRSDVSISSVSWENTAVIDATLLMKHLADAEQPLSENIAVQQVPLQQIYKATVSGVVGGSPEMALDRFQAFVSMLREISSRPTVVVVETPFGLGDQRTTNSDYVSEKSPFTVEIISKPDAQ